MYISNSHTKQAVLSDMIKVNSAKEELEEKYSFGLEKSGNTLQNKHEVKDIRQRGELKQITEKYEYKPYLRTASGSLERKQRTIWDTYQKVMEKLTET